MTYYYLLQAAIIDEKMDSVKEYMVHHSTLVLDTA